MRIIVNGEQRDVTDGMTGLELLQLLQIPVAIAVAEYNGRVLASEQFQQVTLADGDMLELVTLVGGG